jgi:hypothetical protein
MRSLLASAIALFFSFSDVLAQPASHRGRAAEVPDFLQTDREAGFAKSGSQFCAPTAVSNSLMWLAVNGYEDLRPPGSAKKAQIAMIRKLSGPDFMKTSPSIGTDVTEVLRGVEAYVGEAGYVLSELAYEGWRPAPDEFLASEYPSLDDIKTSADDDQSAVWLNVGWYKYDEEKEEYLRKGGHWVTVVGYDGDDLLIHDPSPSAGAGFRTQRISLEELPAGTLTGNHRNLPRSAEGYYEVGGEMAIGEGWTCILDGAVFMALE